MSGFWYYRQSAQQFGPVEFDKLVENVVSTFLQPDNDVRTGHGDWQLAESVNELIRRFAENARIEKAKVSAQNRIAPAGTRALTSLSVDLEAGFEPDDVEPAIPVCQTPGNMPTPPQIAATEDSHTSRPEQRRTHSRQVETGRSIPPAAMVLVGLLFVLVAILFWPSGTSSEIGRRPVYGTIAGADGKRGTLTFIPIKETKGPSATTGFENGRYKFTELNGPVSGVHKVIIRIQTDETSSDGGPIGLKGASVKNTNSPQRPQYEPTREIEVQVPDIDPYQVDLRDSSDRHSNEKHSMESRK